MGETMMSNQSVFGLLHSLRKEWRGDQYDVLQCNCCHFCDTFCQKLGARPIPEWVMRLAATGKNVTEARCCGLGTEEPMLKPAEASMPCFNTSSACPPGHPGGWDTPNVEIMAEMPWSQRGRLRDKQMMAGQSFDSNA